MKDTSKTSLRRGHNEGNIRRRTDGRWEVRLSAGIDYKTGKPRRTSTCCNTRQEAIAILQQQAHEVRTQGWRDPMSVTLGEWYEYWLDTYMKDTVKQSTYASYRSYFNKHFCVLGKILLKKLEPHTLQEFYNYKFREEGLSPKTLRNYHMALHKCLQQAMKERLLIYNPCDAVTLPGGEKPEISVFTNDQQRALVQASYRHRYGVFIRLDLCTGLRMGELLALKWEDIDFSTAQLHVRRTINRLAKYEAHDGENKTEIVFGTPKTKNSRRTIPLTRTMVDELTRWKQQQAQDKIRAGDKYTDDGFIVTNHHVIDGATSVKVTLYDGESYDAAVIGSDTVVYIDGEILGKPHSREQAVAMISRLAGRSHTVCTGVTIITAEETRTFHETTEVHFYPLTPQEVEWYCSLEEPYDKAGAYGIQAAGALLVQGLTGDYFNVMGLPVAALARHLREMGVTAALSEQTA